MLGGLSLLGERYSMDIILMVYRNPGIKKTDIIRSSPTGERTRAERTNALVEAGLLKIGSGSHWSGQYFTLTEKGERVAELLEKLEAEMEEEA